MSTLETRIAEVLGSHKAVRIQDLIRRDGAFTCSCGSEFTGGPVGYRAHQAAMLAPVIREAQAEALREAADAMGDSELINHWGDGTISMVIVREDGPARGMSIPPNAVVTITGKTP